MRLLLPCVLALCVAGCDSPHAKAAEPFNFGSPRDVVNLPSGDAYLIGGTGIWYLDGLKCWQVEGIGKEVADCSYTALDDGGLYLYSRNKCWLLKDGRISPVAPSSGLPQMTTRSAGEKHDWATATNRQTTLMEIKRQSGDGG